MAKRGRPRSKPQTTDEQRLQEIVRTIIEARKEQLRLSPAWIATEAMDRLKAKGLRSSTSRLLQLRQLAREECRYRFASADDVVPSGAV
jgi:hypothetical protein